jgi:hypothetical protein
MKLPLPRQNGNAERAEPCEPHMPSTLAHLLPYEVAAGGG